METLSQVPFRRLTQLYTDTKQSCDVVTEQEKREDAPELTSLHRKFRIQKNRLIAWGCEWSDTAQVSGAIDEAVARAGLTETVTSVLGTIKDVLDEAEQIRCSDVAQKGLPLGDRKAAQSTCEQPWSIEDRARYEDLAKDLTNSIDILYDLSRSRRAFFNNSSRLGLKEESLRSATLPAIDKKPFFASDEYNFSDLTLINPSTTSTLVDSATSPEHSRPKKLDVGDLELQEEEPPPYFVGATGTHGNGSQCSVPLIGTLAPTTTFTNPWNSEGTQDKRVPVLVEYAYFDAAYQDTKVPPPLARLETLMSVLARHGSGDASKGGLLSCIGYFEDESQPRYGIVYELPHWTTLATLDASNAKAALRPTSLFTVLQNGSRSVHGPNPAPQLSVPPLEDRFRLAYNLVSSFSKIHMEGFLHKDVNSAKVMVFQKPGAQVKTSKGDVALDLRLPYLCSFDLFSEFKVDKRLRPDQHNIYMHPQDPRTGAMHACRYGIEHDLYGLALMMIEIALWLPLSDIFKAKYSLSDFKLRIQEIWIPRLAAKCGTAYMRAVQECFSAATQGAFGVDSLDPPRRLYRRMMSYLQRCSFLEDVDPIEDERPPLQVVASSEETIRPKSPSRASVQTSSVRREAPPPPPPRMRGHITSASTPNIHLASSDLPAKKKRNALMSSLDRLRSPKSSSDFHVDHSQHAMSGSPTSLKSSDGESLKGKEAAVRVIQRAWRKQHAVHKFRDFRGKIVLIQQHWRDRKKRMLSSMSEHSLQPTPETGSMLITTSNESTLALSTLAAPPRRRKTRLQTLKLDQDNLDRWHHSMLPKLERLVSKALRDSSESVSIDLVAIGDTALEARPTILVTCGSTGKVKSVLSRRFPYDSSTFDLRVRKGKIRRSKAKKSPAPRRSNLEPGSPTAVQNPFFQKRPVCGASIGAFRGEHYPPASYGGVVLVDDKPFGMTVHHLLDEPSDEESEDEEPEETFVEPPPRSSAPHHSGPASPISSRRATIDSLPSHDIYDFSSEDELDGVDSDFMEEESDRDFGDFDDSASERSNASTCGDVGGINPEDDNEIVITQPALEDVEDDFFPSEEDKDEDHIDSHILGHVHASSGLRRWARNGTLHEIDWALVALQEDRIQPYNLVLGGKRFADNCPLHFSPTLLEPVSRRGYTTEEDEFPVRVANSEELGNLQVHSFGRTTGLRAGIVGPAMSAVRVKMRRSFSRSWHVLGEFGFGGDSGAWVMDDRSRVCGHVLARCERFRIAYICPMDVLLEDMKRSLNATSITLPGANEVSSPVEPRSSQSTTTTTSSSVTVHAPSSPTTPPLERNVLLRLASVHISDRHSPSPAPPRAPSPPHQHQHQHQHQQHPPSRSHLPSSSSSTSHRAPTSSSSSSTIIASNNHRHPHPQSQSQPRKRPHQPTPLNASSPPPSSSAAAAPARRQAHAVPVLDFA